MTARQRAYQTKLRALERQAGRLEQDAAQRALEVLEQVRQEVMAELRDTPPERFRAFFLRELRQSVDQRVAELERRLTQEIAPKVRAALETGRQSIQEPAAVLGVDVPLIAIPQNLVDVVQGFTADLIKRISDEARSRVSADIAAAILRGDSVLDAARRIGHSLHQPGTTFGGISAKAERIARTEVLRAYSIAQQASLRQMADYVPALKKQWIVALDDRVRPAHRRAHGQVREWDEPFDVDGEELMYPRDPGGSPGNTINCRCVVVPVLPQVEAGPAAPALPRRGGTPALGELVAVGAG
ncbi:MAG: minor capsid protein [Candidatus Omnitrophica bacterium]|nr:minor capsid protein [Candidatus Omnitrophota bacterium]